MRRVVCWIALSLVATTVSFSQTPTPQPDALGLLKHVAQHYGDAKTYAISATEEMTQTGEYQRMWAKTLIAAAEAPGGRYYYEGHGNMGGALRVSDGKTAWRYHIEEKHYTAKPVAESDRETKGVIPIAEIPLLSAENLRRSLAGVARQFHSASFSSEETLTVGGGPVRCVVIVLRNSDENRTDPNAVMQKTIWIDNGRQTIVKIEDKRDVAHVNTPKGMPLHQVTTTTYTKTELDGAVPEDVFTFVPPPDSILVSSFPDPRDGYGLPTLAGDPVPALRFKSADGKVVPIESFRGKPVLIDFWATWCAPCLAAMPHLAEMYKSAKDKLVLISVDQDEDAAKASNFLAEKGYSWPNFHDGDGNIAKLMGSSPIPRIILVDPKGQIVYDGTGADEERVRLRLAQLGPEFSDFAAKPKQAPCDVTAQAK